VRLVDLDPGWIWAGGEGITRQDPATGEQVPVPERRGVGVMCNCPCGCDQRLYVPFRNPLDDGPSYDPDRPAWDRTGDTFETLTLTPSIRRAHGCGWHGFITGGEIQTCGDSPPTGRAPG
jgi:hypothetical protein